MKYRLKNKELQRKLDEISNGNFSTQLQDVWSKNEDRSVATFDFGDYLRDDSIWRKFTATIYEDEIEEVPEYDPTTWNEWPDVEPPRNKLLRTEILTERIDWDTPEPRGGQSRFKGSGIFDGTEWYFYDATTRKEGETVRFRPWDEGDGE